MVVCVEKNNTVGRGLERVGGTVLASVQERLL